MKIFLVMLMFFADESVRFSWVLILYMKCTQ